MNILFQVAYLSLVATLDGFSLICLLLFLNTQN